MKSRKFTTILAMVAAISAFAASDKSNSRSEGLFRSQVHRGGGRNTRPDNSLETFLWKFLGPGPEKTSFSRGELLNICK